jgi:hypothetical protein
MKTSPSRTAAALAVAANAAIVASAMAFDTAGLGQGGSVVMTDIMPLIEQSPPLKREVTEAAAKIGKKPDDVVCGGMRFSGRWTHLGGYRVSPYICMFGDDRFLEIRADVRITGRNGKAFDKVTPDAMKNASRIHETRPTWRWLNEDPRLTNQQ